jgi:hypothetical protein
VLKRSSVIVEITPTRLELVVVRSGQIGQGRVERANPPAHDADLADTLRARHATLAGWVKELGLHSWPSTILFSSTTETCSLFSCPASAGPAALDSAARMALSEIAGYDIAGHPVDVQPMGTDTKALSKPNPGIREGDTQGQPMAHALAAVEQDQIAELLARWATSTGLTVAGLVPTTAAPIASALTRLLALPPTDSQPSALLWIGEHESFLAVGDGAGLRLFRTMGIGVESLVEALQRPIQPRTAGAEAISIDRAAARTLLEKFGVPRPDDLLDPRLDLSGQSIIPLLSPVLQRAAVELKQSLRFGLVEKDRADIQITIIGPGATLPGLAEAFTHLCAAQVVAEAPAVVNTGTGNSSASTGNIAAFLAANTLTLSLLPNTMQQACLVSKTRRALWAGIAASAAMVGIYAGWTWLSLFAAQREIASLKVQSETGQRLDGQRRALLATQHAAKLAAVRINDALGVMPQWSAVLAGLVHATPEHTLIKSIDMGEGEGGPTARLSCTIQAEDDAVFAQRLKAYTDRLTAMPIIRGVKMGSTARAAAAPGAQANEFNFDLAILLVATPYAYNVPAPFTAVMPSNNSANVQSERVAGAPGEGGAQ